MVTSVLCQSARQAGARVRPLRLAPTRPTLAEEVGATASARAQAQERKRPLITRSYDLGTTRTSKGSGSRGNFFAGLHVPEVPVDPGKCGQINFLKRGFPVRPVRDGTAENNWPDPDTLGAGNFSRLWQPC